MKKVLLILFVLAILLLAFPQGVLADTSQPVTVSSTIDTYLDLRKTDTGTTGWAFTSGSEITPFVNQFYIQKGYYPISLEISTNKGWEVAASADGSGKMYATLINKWLKDEMEITKNDAGQTEVWQKLATAGFKINSGSTVGATPFTRDLKQPVWSSDPVGAYSITITFTASNV